MKKYFALILLFFLILNVHALNAATEDDPVSDLFEEDQSELIEQDASDELIDQETDETEPVLLTNQSPNIFGLIIRIVLVLALIIGLIYILLKLFNRSNYFNKQGDLLVNLGGISLGTNKSVQMLKVGDKIYLVGVGDNISILSEVTDESVKEQILNKQEPPAVTMTSLLEKVNFKQRSNDKSDQQEHTADKNQNFASMFKGELDAMKEKREEIRDKYKEEE